MADDKCTMIRPIPSNLLLVTRLFREKYPRIDMALCLDVGQGLRIIATLPSGADQTELVEGPEDDLSRWVFYVLNTDRGERRPDRDTYWESLQVELDEENFNGVEVLLCSPDIEYQKPN